MNGKEAKVAAQLVEALSILPKVYRSLTERPVRHCDGIHLEIQAAEMQDGLNQGATHYFNLPPPIGREVLDAAEKIIRARLKALGVTP